MTTVLHVAGLSEPARRRLLTAIAEENRADLEDDLHPHRFSPTAAYPDWCTDCREPFTARTPEEPTA